MKRAIIRIICALMALSFALALFSACNGEEDKKESGASGDPFSVSYKGITIKLDASAEKVLSSLGEPKATDNLGDCGGIGVQTKYEYADIAVNTLEEKDGEVIHKIELLNDLVATSEGITIGADEDSVRDAYGKPSSESNGKLTYKKGNLELEFTVKGGSVSAINYRRIV